MNTFPIKEQRSVFIPLCLWVRWSWINMTWGYLRFSLPTPSAWLRPLVWLCCVPKRSIVGQVVLSALCTMSTKSQNQWPILTMQHCGCAGWDLAWLGTAGSRNGKLWTGMEPDVWTISRPELSGNKSTAAAAWTSISTIFCRTYGPLEYPGRLPGLL